MQRCCPLRATLTHGCWQAEITAFMNKSNPTIADTAAYKDKLARFKDVQTRLDETADVQPPDPTQTEPASHEHPAGPSSQMAHEYGRAPATSAPPPISSPSSAAAPPPVCVVQCPTCKNNLRVPREECTRTYQCPACSSRFMVAPPPAPTAASPPAPETAPPTPPPPPPPSRPDPSPASQQPADVPQFQAACPRCRHPCRCALGSCDRDGTRAIVRLGLHPCHCHQNLRLLPAAHTDPCHP